jgi:hypothetical protein
MQCKQQPGYKEGPLNHRNNFSWMSRLLCCNGSLGLLLLLLESGFPGGLFGIVGL